jgi:hypothetical protein
MEHAIDLLILPPHTSHVLQPLDVSMFSLLKRALAAETDTASRLDYGRISRTEWTTMYIRARQDAFRSSNIISSFKATGLWPLSPITVLEKLPTQQPLQPLEPHDTTVPASLDLSLLLSDPQDGTELREANAVCNMEINKADSIPLPVKRYVARMTRAFEATQSELSTLRKEVAEQQKLLQVRKKRLTGKRISLKGKFVFSTQEVLEVARQAEQATAEKTARTQRRKRAISVEIEGDDENTFENISTDSESNCIAVVRRKMN